MVQFNPTLPAANAPLDSQQMRDQFNALKTMVDALPDRLEIDATLNQNTAVNCDQVQRLLSLTISNPPTQAEVQAVLDKLNELIGALQH